MAEEINDIDDVLNDIFNENSGESQLHEKTKDVEKEKPKQKKKSPVVEADFDSTEESEEDETVSDEPEEIDLDNLEDPLEEVFGEPQPTLKFKKKEEKDESESKPKARKPKLTPAPPKRRKRRVEAPEQSKAEVKQPEPKKPVSQQESAADNSSGSWQEFFKPVKRELKTVILIDGAEGTGKTHWAVTQTPGPHYLIDTEGEHNLHTANDVCDDLYALVIRSNPLQRPAKVWFGGANSMWGQVEKAGYSLKDAPSGTVIIDSGTDLLPMVVSQLNIDWDRGNDAFPPMLYGQVYGVLGTFITYIRQYHHVVITAKLKEQWRGNNPTGKMERSIWNNAEHLCEHLLSLRKEDEEIIYYFQRKKRGTPVPLRNITWDHIVKGISDEERQKAEYSATVKRLKKAVQTLKKLEVDFPTEIPKNLSGAKELLEQANQKYKEVQQQKEKEKRSRRRKPKQSEN